MTPAPSSHRDDFDRIYLTAESALRRYILMVLPNPNDANDILQQTALALWNKFDSYDRSKPFQQWAFGFAAMEVKRFLRRQASSQRWINEAAAEQIYAQVSPEALDLERQKFQKLSECLRQLPPRHQSMVRSYYFHKMTVPEVASFIGTSTEAIYKGLQRIRQALQQCLQG